MPVCEPSGNVGVEFGERDWRTRRRHDPPLVDERGAARREPVPHAFDRIHAESDSCPDPRDRQELVVDHVQEIARREPVGRRHDVGPAPPEELLSGVQRQPPLADRRAQTADGQGRPQPPTIRNIDAPAVVNLVVGVRAEISSCRELNPRRGLDDELFPDEQIARDVDRIVGRILREIRADAFDEPALRNGLRRDRLRRCRDQQNSQQLLHWRRIACSVKSSSFIGTLYWSFSSERRVRLPRRRSLISSVRAVQMP